MRRRAVVAGLLGAGAVGVAVLVRRYRRDRAAAQARLDAVDRRVVTTPFGDVEYAEAGTGDALLVSHGILHGCDGGLRSVRDLAFDRRVVAPSRFGYLGSDMPAGADGAMQADAFVALLDELGLGAVDVVGISAGTGAALQLALRHPERVEHLVIVSGNLPGSPTATVPPDVVRVTFDPVVLWAVQALARPVLRRAMGVPEGLPRDAEQARVVEDMVGSIFPVGPRLEGAIFDACTGLPEVNDYPLEAVAVPTMLVHARDDPLTSYDAAARAAERIPGAVFVGVESGGHLLLGQADRVRAAVASFLAPPAAA